MPISRHFGGQDWPFFSEAQVTTTRPGIPFWTKQIFFDDLKSETLRIRHTTNMPSSVFESQDETSLTKLQSGLCLMHSAPTWCTPPTWAEFCNRKINVRTWRYKPITTSRSLQKLQNNTLVSNLTWAAPYLISTQMKGGKYVSHYFIFFVFTTTRRSSTKLPSKLAMQLAIYHWIVKANREILGQTVVTTRHQTPPSTYKFYLLSRSYFLEIILSGKSTWKESGTQHSS